MSHNPGFTAMVEVTPDHRVLIQDEDRYRALVERLIPGLYEFEMRKHVKSRTLKQNAYLHSKHVLPALALHLGCGVKALKIALMAECFGTEIVAGHEVPVKPHTSEMDVEECKFFIDWLIPWAATEHSFEIPLPNEDFAPTS